MSHGLGVTIPATAALLGCFVLVTLRVALAPGPPPYRAATAIEREAIARTIANAEPGWIEETAQNFPEDHWSQRDDFHGREYRQLVESAKGLGVPVEHLLRGVDDDLHLRKVNGAEVAGAPDDRNARAVPCKPRPFYD